jgi:hypothetical protein
VIDVLFGKAGATPEEADTGYLIFYDAWWVYGLNGIKKPYVPEVVNVHASSYYTNQWENCPHPDLESPNPNNQIAVQGGFYFVGGGKKGWAELGLRFLKKGLEDNGIGNKVSSGYGFFTFPDDKECLAIIHKGNKLFQQAGKKRKKELEELKKHYIRQQEEEKIAGYDLCQLAIYKLNRAVENREGGETTPRDDELNALVNNIIKNSKIDWSNEKRKEAEPIIERAWQISVKSKSRKKKIAKLKNWLETGAYV